MKHSISTKVSTIVLAMVVLSTAVVGIFGYLLYRKDSVAFNADRALSIAQSVASSIDAERFTEIMGTGEKNDYWHAVKGIVDDVKVRTDIKYLYVLDKDYNQDVHYFAEGYDRAASGEDELDLGNKEPVSNFANEMFSTLSTGKATTTNIYTSGAYGRMVSGFSPILDKSGTVAGVVGVDISVEDVVVGSNAFGIKIALIVLGFCIVFVFISVWVVNYLIGRPIGMLTIASGKIALGDMNVDLDVKSDDEIGRLASSFADMVDSTKKQVALLEDLSGGDLTIVVQPRCKKRRHEFGNH